MNVSKKLFALFLALCYVGIIITPAHATEIQPMTESTCNAMACLSIKSSGQASCEITTSARDTSLRIEVSLSLNQINGKTPLKTWSLSGTGSFSATKTYYVVKGYDYQITAKITVKDSSGKLIESFTTNSSVVHY